MKFNLIKKILSRYVLSPFEPYSPMSRLFVMANLSFFLFSVIFQFCIPKSVEDNFSKMSLLGIVWVFFALIACLRIIITDGKRVVPFIFYLIYARNRSLIFLFFINVVYFPIEILISFFVNDYIENGMMKVSTSILTGLSYTYFYYLFLKLIFVFVFNKSSFFNFRE